MRWYVIGRLLLLTSLGCRRTVPTAAENLLAYSEQFANPAWRAGNVTVMEDAAIAPDKSQTAARLTETATYSWHGLNQGFAYVPGTVLFVSVSMKRAAELRERERAVLRGLRPPRRYRDHDRFGIRRGRHRDPPRSPDSKPGQRLVPTADRGLRERHPHDALLRHRTPDHERAVHQLLPGGSDERALHLGRICEPPVVDLCPDGRTDGERVWRGN